MSEMKSNGAALPQREIAFDSAKPPLMRRGIYLLPTLMTVGNMSLGFFSMAKSAAHEFSAAATAVLIGHVLDIFDGRVARWTKTTSRFGIEMDSLADFMTFCVAPAFMMYTLVLQNNPTWGFVIALLFVICGGLRLAKFNIKAHMGEGSAPYFVGLPTPAAGGVLAIFALLYDVMELGRPIRSLKLVMNQVPVFYEIIPAIMLLLSLLMVSDVKYSTFKSINLTRPRSMRMLVLTILAILMIWVYPQNTIFILYVTYIAWGMVDYLLGRAKRPFTHSPSTENIGTKPPAPR